MGLKAKAALLFLSVVLVSSFPVAAPASPLDAFGALVVGEWEAEDSRHVLEWGVGRKTIRGIAVAIGMPVELFEYRSEIRDGEIVHDLVAQGPAGGEYVERWTFTGNEYRWSLEVDKDGKLEPMMGGAYRRSGAKP